MVFFKGWLSAYLTRSWMPALYTCSLPSPIMTLSIIEKHKHTVEYIKFYFIILPNWNDRAVDVIRASSIVPCRVSIIQQGSSSSSFLDFGLHRTMTCTFSFIDVLLLEKEAFKEAELLLGVGSSVGVLGGVGIVKSAMLSKKT